MLERRIFPFTRACQARLQIPARTMVIAQSRALGAELILDTRSAERDIAQ